VQPPGDCKHNEVSVYIPSEDPGVTLMNGAATVRHHFNQTVVFHWIFHYDGHSSHCLNVDILHVEFSTPPQCRQNVLHVACRPIGNMAPVSGVKNRPLSARIQMLNMFTFSIHVKRILHVELLRRTVPVSTITQWQW